MQHGYVYICNIYAYALCDHHKSNIMLEKSLCYSGSWRERTRIYLYRNLFIYLFIYFTGVALHTNMNTTKPLQNITYVTYRPIVQAGTDHRDNLQ
jgi:hypothetical protein